MSYADELERQDQERLARQDREEDPEWLEAKLEYENSHNADDDDESADLDRLDARELEERAARPTAPRRYEMVSDATGYAVWVEEDGEIAVESPFGLSRDHEVKEAVRAHHLYLVELLDAAEQRGRDERINPELGVDEVLRLDG